MHTQLEVAIPSLPPYSPSNHTPLLTGRGAQLIASHHLKQVRPVAHKAAEHRLLALPCIPKEGRQAAHALLPQQAQQLVVGLLAVLLQQAQAAPLQGQHRVLRQGGQGVARGGSLGFQGGSGTQLDGPPMPSWESNGAAVQ